MHHLLNIHNISFHSLILNFNPQISIGLKINKLFKKLFISFLPTYFIFQKFLLLYANLIHFCYFIKLIQSIHLKHNDIIINIITVFFLIKLSISIFMIMNLIRSINLKFRYSKIFLLFELMSMIFNFIYV